MSRPGIAVVAIVAVLLLSACSAPNPDPAEPLPEGSVLPTGAPSTEPDEIAEGPFSPCSDDDAGALGELYPGEVAGPPGDYYPEFLPTPSCVFEDADFANATVFFLPATQTDFDTLQAAITAEQGAGVPSDGQGLTAAGTVWDGQQVPAMYLVPASFGVAIDYIVIQFDVV